MFKIIRTNNENATKTLSVYNFHFVVILSFLIALVFKFLNVALNVCVSAFVFTL